MNRGDFVTRTYILDRPFRGLVIDTWESSAGEPRASIVWENGTISSVGEFGINPSEPFSTPALRKALTGILKIDRLKAVWHADRAAWLSKLLKKGTKK